MQRRGKSAADFVRTACFTYARARRSVCAVRIVPPKAAARSGVRAPPSAQGQVASSARRNKTNSTIMKIRTELSANHSHKLYRKTRFAFCETLFLIQLATCILPPITATAATVTGTLQDISLQSLDTKIMFAPTNGALVTPTGLSAGPPRVIDSVNGAFSVCWKPGITS